MNKGETDRIENKQTEKMRAIEEMFAKHRSMRSQAELKQVVATLSQLKFFR